MRPLQRTMPRTITGVGSLLGMICLAAALQAVKESAAWGFAQQSEVGPVAAEQSSQQESKPDPEAEGKDPAPASTHTADQSQEQDSQQQDSKQQDVSEKVVVEEETFEKLFQQWRTLLGKLRTKRIQYRASQDDEEKAKIKKEYDAGIAEGLMLRPKVRAAAENLYRLDPSNVEAGRFIAAQTQKAFDEDRYGEALTKSKLLAEKKYRNANVFRIAGVAALEINQFEDAKKYLPKILEHKLRLANPLEQRLGMQTPISSAADVLKGIEYRKERWEQEQQLRKQDAQANLPRVKLTTTKGEILLELFEDQAPNTVANFINLVESGFYTDKQFHRVIGGFMAQGGRSPDGLGDPNYTIPCECYRDDARLHFRGSLSLARTQLRDSGCAQFFICYRATLELDRLYTVFGRVLEGMDVATSLNRIDPQNSTPSDPPPDRIIKAEVIRKRDHQYTVRKVGDPEPATTKPENSDPKQADPEKAEPGMTEAQQTEPKDPDSGEADGEQSGQTEQPEQTKTSSRENPQTGTSEDATTIQADSESSAKITPDEPEAKQDD